MVLCMIVLGGEIHLCLQDKPALRNVKVLGTDGDQNLSSSFSACFGDAYHLLYDLHMYDNVQRKLTDIYIPRKIAKLYLEEMLGKDCDASPVKSLVNCSSPSEFDSLFETLKSSWISRHKNGEQFVHYFSKYKAPEPQALCLESRCGFISSGTVMKEGIKYLLCSLTQLSFVWKYNFILLASPL